MSDGGAAAAWPAQLYCFFFLSSMQSSTNHYSLFFTTGFHSAWSKFLWTPKRWVVWLLLPPLHTAYIVDLSLTALANMRANGMTDFCFKLSHSPMKWKRLYIRSAFSSDAKILEKNTMRREVLTHWVPDFLFNKAQSQLGSCTGHKKIWTVFLRKQKIWTV